MVATSSKAILILGKTIKHDQQFPTHYTAVLRFGRPMSEEKCGAQRRTLLRLLGRQTKLKNAMKALSKFTAKKGLPKATCTSPDHEDLLHDRGPCNEDSKFEYVVTYRIGAWMLGNIHVSWADTIQCPFSITASRFALIRGSRVPKPLNLPWNPHTLINNLSCYGGFRVRVNG